MSFINRVWDTQAGPGFVRWSTIQPDTTGNEYPGPGSFGVDTSNYTIESDFQEKDVSEPRLHDLTYNPVGLWQFEDGDITDQSPTGHDLEFAGSGNHILVPGTRNFKRTLYFQNQNGTDICIRSPNANPAPSALRISGSMTAMVLAYVTSDVTGQYGSLLIKCAKSNFANPDDNYYQFLIRNTLQLRLRYNDSGGSNNDAVTDNNVIVPNKWSHIAFTRDASGGSGNVEVSIYVDGKKVKTNTGLNEAGNFADAYMHFGKNNPDVSSYNEFNGAILSPIIIPSVLTDQQILDEAKATLPYYERP